MLSAIHERESTPFTKAPSKGNAVALAGRGNGSLKAARRAQMELRSSLFICLAISGKPDDASNLFAHFPERE